ncbi:hypothetical protein Taro_053541 [Colocasia esculenta]|uniref:Uncharacterized protein n=1 Tax=Colocasia esculenta TaxID=4460 RepID=A0A843XN39_COLES|nr:hypothetical protein [Colocasia esculenta]
MEFLTLFLSESRHSSLHGGCSLAVSASMGFVRLASWALFSDFCSAGSLGVQGGSVCGPSTLWRSEVAVPMVRHSFSRGCSVSLVVTPGCSFPTLWRSGMLGSCVVRLWSHVVAPVFRELRCLGGCVPSALCLTPLVLWESCLARPWLWVMALLCSSSLVPLLLEFLLLWLVRDWLSLLSLVREAHPPYSLQVGTRCHRSSLSNGRGGDPWVAARPSGSLAGGPRGRVIIEFKCLDKRMTNDISYTVQLLSISRLLHGTTSSVSMRESTEYEDLRRS